MNVDLHDSAFMRADAGPFTIFSSVLGLDAPYVMCDYDELVLQTLLRDCPQPIQYDGFEFVFSSRRVRR